MTRIQIGIILAATLSVSIAWAQDDAEDKLRAEDALKDANEAAARSKFTVAVPKYREVLRLGDGAHPLAYYNLAEVQKVRGKCREAVKTYQMYASVVGTEQARKEAATGVKKCKATDWPKLHVVAKPSDARIYIDGVLASTTGEFGPVVMPKGKYEVRMEAVDHHPKTRTVELADEDANVETSLEEMTFFGGVIVKTEVDGARVRIFAGPSESTKQLYDLRTPMEKAVKLEEGRHFVEVTADGYDRWIRNVSVARDDDVVVDVRLTKSLPPELQE